MTIDMLCQRIRRALFSNHLVSGLQRVRRRLF